MLGSANDRTTEWGDHNFYAFVAFEKLVSQDFAAQESFAPSAVGWGSVDAASRQAGADFIRAAWIARIGNAPGDFDWWRWWAADWLGCTAGRCETTGIGCRSNRCEHGHRHAGHHETTNTFHRNSLVVSGDTVTNSVSARHFYRALQFVQTVLFAQDANLSPVLWFARLFRFTGVIVSGRR